MAGTRTFQGIIGLSLLSYGVRSLHSSLLFLIGASLIYGVTGTLNMADIAAQIPAVPAVRRQTA